MNKNLIILFLLFSYSSIAQKSTEHYKKVYPYDEYINDWALVKTVADTYGFIDKKGNEVVQAVYSKIYKFELKKDNKKYAMIENVAGAYGFIDENGKVVIEDIHWKKEEAIQKLELYMNR